MILRSAICPVHVGRDQEVAALRATLDSLPSGSGRLTLLSGEAGVGKSRLVSEVIARSSDAGRSVLEGRSTPGAALPYGAFVTAVRRRTRTLDADRLAALFDGAASLAAALLPEVVSAIGMPSSNPAPEDLFAAVWQLLARLAGPGGAVLVLEDLHWADQDSLRLLSYLARELDDLPVWILGTYRSDELQRRHPLTAVLTQLGRERRYDEISLEPLRREALTAMLSAIFDGTEVGHEFSDRVLERTGGNPFFVEELSKMMLDNGDIYHADDDWQRRALAEIQMPLSVRETLLARARTMEPRSYEILRIAAVSAIDLDLAVLAGAAGATPEQVDDAVKEGLAQQVLVEHREGHSVRYAFRHALSREAFADELVGPDRSRAHRAVAEAISQVHADDLDSVAAALADHFAESGDQVAALEFALRAARSAAAAFAVEEADSRYDQALRLMGPADDRRLEVLLEAAGDREFSDISRTRISFAEEARRLAMANGDRLAEARMLYVLENAAWLAGDTAGSIGLLREALDRVHGIDDHEEAWTLRRLTRVLTLGDHLDEAAALLPGSIELARSSGNLGALSGLYGTRMLQEGHGDGFRSAYTAAVETARSAGDVMSEYNVSINAGYVSIWSGDFAESRRSMRHAVAMGEQIAPRDRYAAAGLAWLLSLTGEYVEAKAIAAKLGPSYPLPTRVVALTALTEVAQREGDPEAAALSDELWDLARSTGENQRSVPALAARARQTLIDSGVDEALPLFQAAATNTVNTRMGGSQWPFAPDLAGALGAQGRTVELESWVELVSRIGANDPHAHNLASSTLCRGFVASSHGDLDQALALFEEAAARYRALPCPAREVEALLGQSDVESRAGRPDGGSGSAGRAFDLATSIGAVLLADQARQAVERSQAQPVLATILFTDIVGSTELAASLGDRAWREMLTRHHSIVRRELARGRGREVDTAGDGFHVAFDTPAQAIRCAVAVRDSLAAAGISIRAGVHTGECQESGGKLTGLAVHIASRVSQRAGPGEVLASGTVRELVVGSGFSFEERGSHQLKGVPGEWLLFAVRR